MQVDFDWNHNYSYYEPFYEWLAYFTKEQYFVWRLCIWGIAVFFIYHLSFRLKSLTWEFLLSIVLILPTSYFIATRGSAGYALLLWSTIWLLPSNEDTQRNIILGVAGIVASYFLHRSMIIFIALSAMALLPFKFNKKFILASLVAFPFLVAMVNGYLADFLSGTLQISFGDEMNITERAYRYADGSEEGAFNIMGKISLVITRGPYYLMLLYCIIQSTYNKREVSIPYLYMLKLTYLCFYAGLLFAFQDSSTWLYQRITYMGFFPLVFIFPKFISTDNKRSHFLKFILYFSLFSVAWYFMYRYYKWS